MASAFPIAISGRGAQIAQAVQEKVLPEIDVVHSCLTPSAAMTELPALCAGNLSVDPTSELGSNLGKPESARQVPKVVFFGGAIGDEEYEHVTKAIMDRAGPDAVQFMRVTPEDVAALGGSGPDPDLIAKIYRLKIGKLQMATGPDGVGGEGRD